VRHGGAAKQRVWLGPGRYRGCCRDAVTNRDAESYANSNSYTCCMRAGVTNSNCDCDRDSHSYSYCYSNCYADSDGDTYTAEACSNTKASSHATASAVIPK